MPPNVTNVVPEILAVTSQKRAANTGEFESALSTAIDSQTPSTPNAEAPEKAADTEPTETPASNTETTIPDEVLAILMALMAQPPVVVATPQPQTNEEEPQQPAPVATPEALPFAAGLLVNNEQPMPKTKGEKEKKGETDSNKEIPFQFKPVPAKDYSASKDHPTSLETSAINPAKAPDLTRDLAEKAQPKTEAVAMAAPDAPVVRVQVETPSKPNTTQAETNAPAVNISAPASPKPPDVLVEAATLSPLEQATQNVPEPVRTVAMSIGRLTAEMGQEVRLQLHPESLGRLDVKLNYEGSQVHVHLSAETPQTGDMLQKYQGDLRVILAEAGVAVGQLTVSVGNGRAQQERGATSDERPPAPPTQSKIAPVLARKTDVKTSLIDYRV